MFLRSDFYRYQHGKGVYFTDSLDYCWYYGGEKGNRANFNIIPKIGDNFTLIACSIYYDNNGYLRVYNKYRLIPGKNEINFAYVCAEVETITYPDFTKFVGTDYAIYDFDQIFPYIGEIREK